MISQNFDFGKNKGGAALNWVTPFQLLNKEKKLPFFYSLGWSLGGLKYFLCFMYNKASLISFVRIQSLSKMPANIGQRINTATR